MMLRQDRNYALVVAADDGVITQGNVDDGSLMQGQTPTPALSCSRSWGEVIRGLCSRAAGCGDRQSARRRRHPARTRNAESRVPRQGDLDRRRAADRYAHALDRDRYNPQSRLRAGAGLYGTVELEIPRKAPSLVVLTTSAHLQPQRLGAGRGRSRRQG